MKKGDYKAFCAMIEELKQSDYWQSIGGNNKTLARMLGVSERTLYRWLAGDIAVPLTVNLLLKMIVNAKDS